MEGIKKFLADSIGKEQKEIEEKLFCYLGEELETVVPGKELETVFALKNKSIIKLKYKTVGEIVAGHDRFDRNVLVEYEAISSDFLKEIK